MAYTTVYLGDQRCIVADTFAELPTTDDIVIGTPAKVGKNDYTLSQDRTWIQTSFGGAVGVKASSSVPHAVDVPAIQTGYALSAAGTGTGGAAGDYLDTINFSIKVASSNKITLYDGGTEIWSTTATTAIGFYTVHFRRTSQAGAFTVDTQGNATLMATGEFT